MSRFINSSSLPPGYVTEDIDRMMDEAFEDAMLDSECKLTETQFFGSCGFWMCNSYSAGRNILIGEQ